jgi:hypothetical protein
MELNIERKCCKRTFQRENVQNFHEVPKEEIQAMVEKVELVTEKFRFRRCIKVLIFVYILVAAVCIYQGIRNHKDRMRQINGQNLSRHFGGPTGADGQARPHCKKGFKNWFLRAFHRGGPAQVDPATPVILPAPGAPTAQPDQRTLKRQERFRKMRERMEAHRRMKEERRFKRDQARPIADQAAPIPENVNIQPFRTPGGPEMPTDVILPLNPTNNDSPVSSPIPGPLPPIEPMPIEGPNGTGAAPGVSVEHPTYPGLGQTPYPPAPQPDEPKRRCCGMLWFFVLYPIFVVLLYKKKMRKALRKVKALLNIENAMFRARYHCEWSIDGKLMNLSIKKLPSYTVQQVYVQQPVQGYPTFQNFNQPAPTVQMTEAPMFNGQETPRGIPRAGYQPIALDDSTVGYGHYQ